MILGFTIALPFVAAGGLALLVLLFFQLATGLRWIKLPPKRRMAIHKTTGITLVVLAVAHGLMGLVLTAGITIG